MHGAWWRAVLKDWIGGRFPQRAENPAFMMGAACYLRISAKADTHFGKYSDSLFGLNSDTFCSGATPERDF